MQFLGYVLVQIYEACGYIQDGRLAQLRIALLLLDNAAEIQMEQCIAERLSYDEIRERLRSQALQIPEVERPEILQDLVLWEPLNVKEKHAVSQYFDEKVRYLTKRTKQLDSRLGSSLLYLHKYRNEAYHRSKVRKETIETAAKLLLDINCELLLSLSRGWTYASDGDYSWFEERFGEPAPNLLQNKNLVPDAVAQFRATVDLDDDSIAQLFAKHLESRIHDVFEALDFVVENTRYPDRETAIRDSYGFAKARRKQSGPSGDYSRDAEKRHSVEFLNNLVKRLPEITKKKDRFESFQRFALLESGFEVVEKNVQKLAAEIGGMIEVESDRARGK